MLPIRVAGILCATSALETFLLAREKSLRNRLKVCGHLKAQPNTHRIFQEHLSCLSAFLVPVFILRCLHAFEKLAFSPLSL